MTHQSTARLALLAFFIVAVAGVLLRPLLPIDETRYVAVAWEMWLNGNYLVPTKNFEIYTHKPPLLFWLINLVWAFTGVSDVAARLVGPLFAGIAIWLTGRLARALWPQDPDIGARAMLVLAGMTVFSIYGGLTMFDTMLSVATLAGLLALLRAIETGLARWWVLLGAALAFGVLAKGPVILLHLGPAMLLAPLWARDWGIRWQTALRGAGIALASALGFVGLWLGPAIVTGGPEYRDAILWTQSAGRISDSFAHARPWWFFVALLPALLFPWILIPTIWKAAWRTQWRDTGLSLCAVWSLGALVLFSAVSGKQVHYLMPEFAALALIIAHLLRDRPQFRPVFAALPLLVLTGLAFAAAAEVIDLGNAAALLHPRTALLAWGFFMLAVCWAAIQTGGLHGGVMLSLGFVLSLNLLIGLTDSAKIYDSQPIAALIGPTQDKGIAYTGGSYNAEFNFAARLRGSVALPQDPQALTAWQGDHPEGVVVGPVDGLAPPWPPRSEIQFGDTTYAIWHVVDAPPAEPAS